MKREEKYYFKAKEWFLGKPVLRTIYLTSPKKDKDDLREFWAQFGAYLEEIEEISKEEFEERTK